MATDEEKREARLPLANRLRAVRKVGGWGQEKLARSVGVSKSSLCRWEHADLTPGFDSIQKYASLCGFGLDVAKWIGFGGGAPTDSIAEALAQVETELREQQKKNPRRGKARKRRAA